MHYQANEDEEDADALDELIELLQASSETHGEDDDAWASFRKEIIQRREDYLKGEDARKVSQALMAVVNVLDALWATIVCYICINA